MNICLPELFNVHWHQCYRHSLQVALVWLFPFQNTLNTRAPPSIFVWVRTKQKHSWVSENHQFPLVHQTDIAVKNVRKKKQQPWHSNITGRNCLHVSHFSVWSKGAMYYIAHISQRNRCNYVLGTCLQFSLLCDAGLKTTRDVCTQYTPASFVAEYTVVNQPQWSEFYSSQWPNNNRVCDMWGKAALIHHAYWKTEQYI